MHKKGELGDQLIMFAFMFLLVIIGGGIVFGTSIFIGSEVPFNGVESSLLAYKIKSCLTNGDTTWIDNLKNRSDISLFSEKCGINVQIAEDYYAIGISNLDGSNVLFSYGDYKLCDSTNKYLICSTVKTDKYIIITTSKQRIRRKV